MSDLRIYTRIYVIELSYLRGAYGLMRWDGKSSETVWDMWFGIEGDWCWVWRGWDGVAGYIEMVWIRDHLACHKFNDSQLVMFRSCAVNYCMPKLSFSSVWKIQKSICSLQYVKNKEILSSSGVSCSHVKEFGENLIVFVTQWVVSECSTFGDRYPVVVNLKIYNTTWPLKRKFWLQATPLTNVGNCGCQLKFMHILKFAPS